MVAGEMISDRAQRYLATLERRPSVMDRARIEGAFATAGIPVIEPLVDFQLTFGGFVQRYGFNEFVWGILHSRPGRDSAFERDRLHVLRRKEEVFVTCADCHRSDHWFLDVSGALYWCFAPPVAVSFATKIERDAIAESLDGAQRFAPSMPAPELIAALVPHIQAGLIAEASDAYETLYMHDGIYAAVKEDDIIVFVYDERGRSLLSALAIR